MERAFKVLLFIIFTSCGSSVNVRLTTSDVAKYLSNVSDCTVVDDIKSINDVKISQSLQYLAYFHVTHKKVNININGLSSGEIVSFFSDRIEGKTYLNVHFKLLIESGHEDFSVHTFNESDILIKTSYLKRYHDVNVTLIFKGVDSIDRCTYDVNPVFGYVDFDEYDMPGVLEALEYDSVLKARNNKMLANKNIVATEEGYYLGKHAGIIFLNRGLCTPNSC